MNEGSRQADLVGSMGVEDEDDDEDEGRFANDWRTRKRPIIVLGKPHV